MASAGRLRSRPCRILGDDIETRLAVLEREVARLREQTALANTEAARADADAARVLAGGADRGVSEVRAELRAHIQTLNPLRETQLEQSQEMAEGFAEMRTEMGRLQAEIREGFATQATGMAQITALLTMIAGPENPQLTSAKGLPRLTTVSRPAMTLGSSARFSAAASSAARSGASWACTSTSISSAG
ncbi:MAG TPA: hypothetical protein VFO16_20085 [Pseudonocardiaceae bacterium]|nr:hypothetical protein [Pseudonocardiaceae bacterium]